MQSAERPLVRPRARHVLIERRRHIVTFAGGDFDILASSGPGFLGADVDACLSGCAGLEIQCCADSGSEVKCKAEGKRNLHLGLLCRC